MNKEPEPEDVADFRPIKKPDIIHDQIDEALQKIPTRDKIKLMEEVRNNPPQVGEMKTQIPDGLYEIDLDTLLSAQLNDCPATVIPMLIDHGVRTAVDIKETYKPEKRILGFQYWWVIFLVIGLIGMVLILNTMFKIF